jgi:hypothetical protein
VSAFKSSGEVGPSLTTTSICLASPPSMENLRV